MTPDPTTVAEQTAAGVLAGGFGNSVKTIQLGKEFVGLFNVINPATNQPYGPRDQIPIPEVLAAAHNMSSTDKQGLVSRMSGPYINQYQNVDNSGNVPIGVFDRAVSQMLTDAKGVNGGGNLTTYWSVAGRNARTQFIGTTKVQRRQQQLAESQYGLQVRQATVAQEETAYNAGNTDIVNWGLTDLRDSIYVMAMQGYSGPTIEAWIKTTPQYKDAFQGLDEYRKQYDSAFSEQQYLSLKANIMTTGQNLGIDPSLLTNASVGKLIAGGVSADEFKARIVDGYNVIKNADATVKRELMLQHGMTEKDMLNAAFDPKYSHVKLGRSAEQAMIGGYSKEVGLGSLGKYGSMQLARKIVSSADATRAGLPGDYTRANLENAIQMASKDKGLMTNAPGTIGQPSVNQSQLIGSQIAGYQGTEMVSAQKAVQKAQQARMAPFQKGGGFTETAKGVIGVGSARQ